MGSGSSGPYGKSQPFAPTYYVEKSMHQRDIEAGIFHDGHYDKNPTAKNLTEMINGNYIGDKRTNLDLPYVITTSGDIIVGRRNGNGKEGLATPHPTLIGGENPEVAMAGMLHIHGGKIASYDTNSGHFKPNSKSMPAADAAFSKLPPNLFKKKRGK
jgi:hypothetical protein